MKLKANIIKPKSKFTLSDLKELIDKAEHDLLNFKGEVQSNGRIIYKKRKQKSPLK